MWQDSYRPDNIPASITSLAKWLTDCSSTRPSIPLNSSLVFVVDLVATGLCLDHSPECIIIYPCTMIDLCIPGLTEHTW